MKTSQWLYGIILGILLLVLQAINYKTIVRDISLEMYALILGLIFIGVGIWIGKLIVTKKIPLPSFRRDTIYTLSEREMEVLHAMADGLSNQEIADKLFVSLNTIKTHTSNIYSKLNVQRRTQAVQKAREHRLI